MFEKLKNIALSAMDDKTIEVKADSKFMADLKINSYDLIELVCKVEDEFDVEIPDKKLRSLVTINDVINLIESQK